VAACLHAQGKAAEALPLYRKALLIREKVLGLDHPDTAQSYNNVASCLQAQGKAAEALPLFRKALLIQEKVLGLDHPDTAASTASQERLSVRRPRQ
jgi:tetratricopeptide (TPR) repeat protein